MILSNRLGWIGVDIGTRTVKLAQAVRSADGVRLYQSAVVQRSTPWSDDDGLGLGAPDQSTAEIRAALECGQFVGRSAACLLPMNACELRGLNVPQGSDRERRAMIANELAEDWSTRSAAMEFDYWELNVDRETTTVDGFNINILAVARPWIARVAQDCQQSRLDCWALDGGPPATAALSDSPRICAVPLEPWRSIGDIRMSRSRLWATIGRSMCAAFRTADSAAAWNRSKQHWASPSTRPNFW